MAHVRGRTRRDQRGGEKKLATYGEGVVGVLAGLTAPGDTGGDTDPDDWPEEEPQPDWE
ncbi:hypothetical protein SHKM778_07450 [Streptomyces sp. KM77-8]|uniref:Uncharacterized protein n=1 Tax=Streptomyces haneummycinicus TaxID=3074435 RepID=A0AAT9HAE2_9ACTN